MKEETMTMVLGIGRTFVYLLCVCCVWMSPMFLFAAERPGGGDWPNWRGPTYSGTAVDCAEELVDDLNDAVFLWESADPIPGSISPAGWLCGGFASPVIADGRVYLGYFAADGRTNYVMTEADRASLGNYQINPNIFEADDVIHCFDAATGKTLWRTAFKGKGVTYPAAKPGSHMVPAVYEGKVYLPGTSGRFYCVDAVTGTPLWEANVGEKHKQFEAIKTKKAYYFKIWWNGLSSCASAADGVVAINDCSGGLLGFDAVTGKQLWRAAGACSWWATYPIPWKSNGEYYFITYVEKNKENPPRMFCTEAKTGKVMWTFPADLDVLAGHPAISGDVIVGGGSGGLTAVKLHPTEPKKLWQISLSPGSSAWSSPSVMGKHVYVPGGTEQVCVEMATGKIVGRVTLPGPECSSFTAVNGRIIYPSVSRGPTGNFYMYKADSTELDDVMDLKVLGKPWPVESYANSTTPIVVNGRLYFRGERNLYCYDLRKSAALDAAKSGNRKTPTKHPPIPPPKPIEVPFGETSAPAIDLP